MHFFALSDKLNWLVLTNFVKAKGAFFMMMNKRLIELVPESKKYIARNVLFQLLSLFANIGMMAQIALFLQGAFLGKNDREAILKTVLVALSALAIRALCTIRSHRMAYLSAKNVKLTLRKAIYQKLLRLGSDDRQKVKSSEVVQVAVEGVEQLETYFGQYLPQLFYATLSPLILFAVLSRISFSSALVLFVCVPLIPATIVLIQRFAKRLLKRYWGQYTALGDTFLENLQGLNTSKIYGADAFKHREMNEQAERFRKVTMKVLTMQLNSITVMDVVAYGGAALGMILAVRSLQAGRVTLFGALLIILLAADFFLPMRMLGSFFHIAMNGMAASDKIFSLLDSPEKEKGTQVLEKLDEILIRDMSFSYERERPILKHISSVYRAGTLSAVVGESGCGKSTLAGILSGKNTGYQGSITYSGTELSALKEQSLLSKICYIGHQSYLFKGTVRENLLMAKADASEAEMWDVLARVRLAGFLKSEKGLDTVLQEKASNLSGGQCQRLALARALLLDADFYIFDEATSNIDVESEQAILAQIDVLAKTKGVLMIAHRLANVVGAARIDVFHQGILAESGTHQELMALNGHYRRMFSQQADLENLVEGGQEH